MSLPVDISVEAVAENQIQEVTLEGQEVYVQPLSMSENLTKLAHKIDFSQSESEEKGKPTTETEEQVEKTKDSFQPPTWVWDSVHAKLKNSLTEVNVLLDLLNVAKETRYMVLDPVVQSDPESKTAYSLVSKKKCLGAAGAILHKGADRLLKSQIEMNTRRQQTDFHYELLRLRQEWKLKRVGTTIIGDLSYKSAGSRFWMSGAFEVSKTNNDGTAPIDPTGASGNSTLQVTVPSALEGVAYIQVSIKRVSDNTNLASAELMQPMPLAGNIGQDRQHWKPKLENAQNVIFCKEVFGQLAREASQLRSPVSHLVVSNQIFSQLFPGIQLCIALCHQTGKDRKGPMSPQKADHNHVLEHSLHQLLRERHYQMVHQSMPHPVTALVGMSKKRRLAGPTASSLDDLVRMSHSESLLGQIIKQAKHALLQQRVIQTIDEMAASCSDAQITVHWCNINSATELSIKVVITAAGYENVRTSLVFHVGIDSIKAVNRDGRVMHLSYEEQELRDLLLSQMTQHHIICIQQMAKLMGWQVLTLNPHLGIGDVEPLGNVVATLLASPNGQRVMSIRASPNSGTRVSIQTSPREPPIPNDTVVVNPKWLNLGGPFREVNISQVPGKNLINKLELLMACLTN